MAGALASLTTTRAAGHSLGRSDCERLRDGVLAQPFNALSSLALVAAAGSIARRARATNNGKHQELGALAAAAGAAGFGSLLFHGPQPRAAKCVHDLSVVTLGLCVLTTDARARLGSLASRPAPYRQALMWLGLGLTALRMGRTGSRLCDPDRLVQLHGLWHVCVALALHSYARARIIEGTARTRGPLAGGGDDAPKEPR
jgi:hypothetical protein